MKKNVFYTLMIALIMVVNVLFSGCNLLMTDSNKYYEQVVAKVGDYEITKLELVNAYENYGSSYMQYGYSTEDALNATLDALINREVLFQYAKGVYGELETWEKAEVWEQVFDYVNEKEVLTYVNEIRTKRDLETLTAETEEEATDEEKVEFVDFEATFEKVFANDEHVGYEKIVEDTHNRNLTFTINDFRFTDWGSSEEDRDINALAQKQFYYVLRNNSNEENLSDSKLLENHLNEVYESNEKSYYITKLQEDFEKEHNISNESILNKYQELVALDYAKYATNKNAYISAVQSDPSTVFYHPYGTELVRISHILIKYDVNDDNYNLKDVYKKDFENGKISIDQYNQLIADSNLGAQCKVYQYEDGVLSKTEGTAKDNYNNNITDANILWNFVQEEMSNEKLLASKGACDIEAKAQRFQELAYQFNQDSGLFKSEANYAVQLDTEFADTMVKEFADLSREIYNEQGVGGIGICFTQYGAHIVFVSGEINNPIVKVTNSAEGPSDLTHAFDNMTIEQLANAKVRPAYSKTLLDVVLEKVNAEDFATYEEQLIKQLKLDNYTGDNAIEIDQKAIEQLING